MIALDGQATGDTTVNANSLTYAHVCSGQNRILFVGAQAYTAGTGATGDIITGITYAGSAMTQLQKQNGASTYQRYHYLYMISNPTSGTNNVVISASSAGFRLTASSLSYKNARLVGQPNGSGKNQTASGTSLTTTGTTTINNCWMVSYVTCPLGTPNLASGGTIRSGATSFNSWMGDSNGAITPPKAYDIVWSNGTSPYNVLQAWFMPSESGGAFLENFT